MYRNLITFSFVDMVIKWSLVHHGGCMSLGSIIYSSQNPWTKTCPGFDVSQSLRQSIYQIHKGEEEENASSTIS
jgi:hypothetical protein